MVKDHGEMVKKKPCQKTNEYFILESYQWYLKTN